MDRFAREGASENIAEQDREIQEQCVQALEHTCLLPCNFNNISINSGISINPISYTLTTRTMQGIRHALGTVGIGGEKGPHPYMMECALEQLTIDHVPKKPLIRKVFQPYISIMRNDDTTTRRHTFTSTNYDLTARPPIHYDQIFKLEFDKADKLIIELFNDADTFHPHQLVAHATFNIQDLLAAAPTAKVAKGTPVATRDLELPLVEAVGKLDKFMGKHPAAAAGEGVTETLGKIKFRVKLFEAAPVEPAPLAESKPAAGSTVVPPVTKTATSAVPQQASSVPQQTTAVGQV